MKKNRETVTIEDVAALAGVSRATVGRIVGGYGSVSERTREKVQQAIAQLNYSPNAVAQSLRNRQTKTIAVVVGNVANRFFSKVVSVIEDEATRQGYSLIICSTHEDAQMEVHHLQGLQSRRVDAIILASLQDTVSETERALYDPDIPIVYIDHGISNIPHDLIETANYDGAMEATEYLIGLGHKKIGVLATTQFPTVVQRLAGYRSALEKHGIPYDPSLVIDQKYRTENPGCEMVRELFLLNEEVTALLILNNALCESVLLELRRMGKRIPEDLSLITWDDTSLNELLDITSIAQYPELMGKVAADQAIRRVKESLDSSEPRQELFIKTLDVELRKRGSCKKI